MLPQLPADHRRRLTAAVLAALLVTSGAACRREPPGRQFEITGQVLAVSPDGREITVRHDEVKGFMPPMTMPFKVRSAALTKGRLPGDLIKATLVVTDEEAWLSTLEKTGWAPFPEKAEGEAKSFELLKPGDEIPDVTLIDQAGASFRLSSLRGSPVLLTFIYTRCPLPDFCPLMDRRFHEAQRAIVDGRLPAETRLVSVSFDPEFDTPTVLAAHAARVGARPPAWRFATAPTAQIEEFGGRLGLSVIREADNPASITHNLRTAVIDREGRLVTVLNGNTWTVDEAIKAAGRQQ
jgi:protein SCO1/2